jgi:CRISPR-associated protein Cas2
MLQVMVAYDITHNSARRKVSECCLDYGLDRQQYSLFVGQLRPTQLKMLRKALDPLLQEGHILIIQIATDDWAKRVELGEALSHADTE